MRAARLEELSASERMGDHALAVRNRRVWTRVSTSRQVLVLVVLIALAFGTAVYMGLRHPYQDPGAPAAEPMRSTLVPLAPRGAVPGGTAAQLFENSPAAQFREGVEGVNLPAARSTRHFSESQVMAALAAAKEYTVKSALDPAVLTGGAQRSVRLLLDPSQLEQFDRSFDHPADDGQHAATAWLVRFDPAQVALVDTPVRAQGVFSVAETGTSTLEVSADHTFVYALRPAGAGEDRAARADAAGASLFTVRRTMHFRFDRDGLQEHQLIVLQSQQQAGPASCSADAEAYLRPLLAGQKASAEGPEGTDPYATGGGPAVAVCGAMADRAQPRPPGGR
ncbi:hypothetical protein GCM10009544_54890 [Streptomyces stramineus]|uniref:Uncharacterized protein n=1 Tax=Streptomyces stramineus TaxID=173861 RepID=A0ABP3KT14_9ACTN